MLIIAENLNVRNKSYFEALRKHDAKSIETIAETLSEKGADLINIQCSTDGIGDEELMPKVADLVQKKTNLPLCLDSRNIAALEKTVDLCQKPPMINYLSADEADPNQILKLVRNSGAHLILRALKGGVPTTFEGKLFILENLVEKANAEDIPNERLYADPSVVHIARDPGQSNIVNTHYIITALNEMVEPPINTIAWISNISTGLPKAVKSKMNSAFLLYLAGAGLDAAFVDVTDPEIMKTIYLIKAFRDEVVFSITDIS